MTLKTSLFNKGIYKSTIKRCLWGSVLYFVILLICNVLPITLMGEYHLSSDIIYDNGLVFGSVVVSMFVPTVASLLVFRYIHSKKTSVFTHSLPVTRNSVYLSSIAGAFTLMFAPVLACGLILLLMALTGYSYCMTISSCFVWIGMNILTLFLMFSCSCLSANLTGNGFAMVAINGLLHGIVPLVTVTFNQVATFFLYGFKNMNDFISEVVYSNFVVWLGRSADNVAVEYYSDAVANRQFEVGRMFVYIAIAVLFYILSWVIYKVRNLENAEDVAAFKCLNPIFKYLVTFLAAISSFALFGEFMNQSIAVFGATIAIISAVVYFGAEMLLKKSLRVFKSYKGFVVFGVVFVALICFTAFTSFFGFESYVPDADNVESVAVYSHYQYEEPFVEDEDFIKHVTNWHKNHLDQKLGTVLDPGITGGYYTRTHLVYKLSNGKVVERTYYLTENENYKIYEEFYKFNEYKFKAFEMFGNDAESLMSMSVYSEHDGNVARIETKEQKKQLFECLRKDIAALDYGQIHTSTLSTCHVDMEFKSERFVPGMGGSKVSYFSYGLNRNFKNTYKWLKDNGYGNCVTVVNENMPLYVIYDMNLSAAWKAYTSDSTEFDGRVLKNISISNGELKEKVYDYLDNTHFSYGPDKKFYSVICPQDENNYSLLASIPEENIKEFEEFLNK